MDLEQLTPEQSCSGLGQQKSEALRNVGDETGSDGRKAVDKMVPLCFSRLELRRTLRERTQARRCPSRSAKVSSRLVTHRKRQISCTRPQSIAGRAVETLTAAPKTVASCRPCRMFEEATSEVVVPTSGAFSSVSSFSDIAAASLEHEGKEVIDRDCDWSTWHTRPVSTSGRETRTRASYCELDSYF